MSNRKSIISKALQLSYKQYLTYECSLIGLKIGTYSVVKNIGQGAFGSIFLSIQSKTGNLVAIKLLDLELVESQTHPIIKKIKKRHIKTQVEMMTKCSSQNLIQCLGVFQNKSLKLLALEYCNGGTLQKKVKKAGHIEEKTAINILKQILNGLQELHKNGIVHRDLKPQNILIHNDIYKIADFGFSKELETNDFQMQTHHTNLGTLCTMAPQILRGNEYGLQADIWSIGVIFFYMLYGKYPYVSYNQKNLLKQIETKDIFDPKNISKQVKISQNAKCFIRQCLEIRSQDRLNWQNILQHKLFAQQTHNKQITCKYQVSHGSPETKYSLNNQQQVQIDLNTNQNEKQSTNCVNQETIKQVTQSCEQIQVVRMTSQQFERKNKKLNEILTNNRASWTKFVHFQVLRVEFLIKEILQPFELCSKSFLSDRSIIELLFLVTTRCYDDISQYKSQAQLKRGKLVSNFSNMVETWSNRLNDKLQIYSKKLISKSNEIMQVIKSKFLCFTQPNESQERQIFFARLKTSKQKKYSILSYRVQQIKFTQKMFHENIRKITAQKNINSSTISFIQNYERICKLNLKDVGNAYFRTYVTNLCQKI